jgi:catechol 2,3-dioxygenase-like lactoylglutathione lyase family enzyme
MHIEHIAIWVKNLDISADFYDKFFGAKTGVFYSMLKSEWKNRLSEKE